MESPISTRSAILQTLAITGSGYGSSIMDEFRRRSGDRLVLHSGSVYPALTALEEDKLIRRRSGQDEEIHGRACVFELTDAGRAIVEEQRSIVYEIFFPLDEGEEAS